MINSSDILRASILIVDDQEANILLLEQTLRRAGFVCVTSTTNPHEVCELHRQNRYALILLDLQMPGLDGFQVMEGLKKIETNSYLPVLVLTAQPAHKLRALKAGAKDFVSKPFDLAEVLMRVRNLLEVRLLHIESETRTEQAEERFIEAQKIGALGHLAGGVAHDFNNLLAVIIGYSEMIATEAGPDGAVREHNEIIQQAAARAVGLTRQLLIFSRKEAVQPVVLNLNDEVDDLKKLLRRLVAENIEMTIVPGKDIGYIKADSGYIGQVLMNLVVNARDAMPDGGAIRIAINNVVLDENYAVTHSGVLPGDYVMLSVSDTGNGMTEEVKTRIFDAFFTTKPAGKGTGLGLSTCQTIVQQSGGHIGVDSQFGRGTTFKIYFPRIGEPLDGAMALAHTGPLPRGKETLLVVEDDPSVRHLLRDLLEAQGYGVIRAINGHHALHLAGEHKGAPIRLVVTDVVMPLMGGTVMMEWLRTSYPDIKILFTSAYPDDARLRAILLEPGIGFLPKPFTPESLTRKVREMLDHLDAPTPAQPDLFLSALS